MEQQVEGWEVPLYKALVAPRLLWGLPQGTALALFVGGGLGAMVWLPMILITGLAWLALRRVTRYEVAFLGVLLRHITYRYHYEG